MKISRAIIIRNAKKYDFGGGERFPVFLCKELEKLNFNPIIVSRSPKLIFFAKDNKINAIRGWWWSWQNWSGKFALLFPVYLTWQIILTFWYLGLFIQKKPDVIHIQSKDDFIAATWAGKVLGKTVVWTDHADLKHIWMSIGIWYKNPVGKLVHWSARFTDKIMVISKSERSLIGANLKKNDPIMNRLSVIYNGVADIAKEFKKTAKSSFTFCVATRMVSDKGIGEVIKAFNNFSSTYPNDQLLIIGDGPESDKFTQLANKNPQIKMLGYKKDPLGFIAKCDVFVHPTYHEGFSMSILEACMLGKPIITTRVGGNVEIIKDGETGLLVKEKDVDSLQSAMKLLREDPKLRAKLGYNARKQYTAKFDFEKIVKNEIIPIYRRETIK